LIAGDYHLTDSPKNHRLTVIAPTALCIFLFGDNPFSIALFPLLCSLVTISALFFFIFRRSDLLTASLAALFLACNILQITYSTALFPDVIVSCFALLTMISVYNRKASLAVLFFFIGFFAKEIIILVLPIIGIMCVADLRKKQNVRFWSTFSLLFIFAISAIAVSYCLLTGDWNFIYSSVEKYHNETFAVFSNTELIKRFTYEPVIFLLTTLGYAIPLIYVAPSLFKKSYIRTYFLILLALLWWMPTSFTHLSPVLLFGYERMWMMLLAPLSALAAFSVTKAVENERHKYLKSAILVAPAVFIAVYFVIRNSNW